MTRPEGGGALSSMSVLDRVSAIAIMSVFKIRGALHSISVLNRGVVRSAMSRLEEWVVLLSVSGLVDLVPSVMYVLEEGVARANMSVIEEGLPTLLCLG